MTAEELQDMADTYGLYTEEDVKNRLSCELLSIGARNEELEKACDETQELLDKQIEATYKVVEENDELKEKLNKATEILKVVLNKWQEERWILQSEKEVKMIENAMKEVEAFLKEE